MAKRLECPKGKEKVGNKCISKPNVRYQFMGGVMDENADWIWQGYVVAKNRQRAKDVLQMYQIRKFKRRYPKSDVDIIPHDSSTPMKTKKPEGIYGLR